MKHLLKGAMLTLCIMTTPLRAAQEDELSELSELSGKTSSTWQIVKVDKLHDITSYDKREDGKRFRSYKVEALIDNSFEATVCHRLDIDNYTHWFMNVSESRILKRVSDTEFYMYLKLKGRLGVPGRDMPLHVVIQPYTPKRGAVVISYQAVPDFIPVVPGIIRMPVYESVTRLAPVGNNQTHEDTEGYAEPGGTVPSWLVNYFQRHMPYANSLARSRDIPRYEGGKMPCLFKYKE